MRHAKNPWYFHLTTHLLAQKKFSQQGEHKNALVLVGEGRAAARAPMPVAPLLFFAISFKHFSSCLEAAS